MVTDRPVAEQPGGLVRWVLDDEARTARVRSLLYPTYLAVVLVALCVVVLALVVVDHTPDLVTGAVGGAAGLFGVAIPAGLRRCRGRHADHDTGAGNGHQT